MFSITFLSFNFHDRLVRVCFDECAFRSVKFRIENILSRTQSASAWTMLTLLERLLRSYEKNTLRISCMKQRFAMGGSQVSFSSSVVFPTM